MAAMSHYLTKGTNYITGKPQAIFKFNLPPRTTTLPGAHIEALRLYREVCRRLPYILKINQKTHEVHPTAARLNVASQFRKNAYVRNLDLLNAMLSSGYETLYESVWLYNHYHNFAGLVMPQRLDSQGINYMEASKLKGTSEFLKKFYGGHSRPNV